MSQLLDSLDFKVSHLLDSLDFIVSQLMNSLDFKVSQLLDSLDFKVSQLLDSLDFIVSQLLDRLDFKVSLRQMQRACFYLKFKRSNWQNTARFLLESMQIFVSSGLLKGVTGKVR